MDDKHYYKVQDKLEAAPVGSRMTDDSGLRWKKDKDGLWSKDEGGVRLNSLALIAHLEKGINKKYGFANEDADNDNKTKKPAKKPDKNEEMEGLF